MDVLIVIGDQDSYHETEADVVSSPIWLADVLSNEGLTGLFVVQARRAEILAEQGRADVIAALRCHEIGLHGRDVHPIITEDAEGMSWDDGVAALLESEGHELRRLGEVFDVAPVCMSEHRNQSAPQVYRVARNLGIPYLFGNPAAPPRYSVSWYAGALSVPFNAPVPDFLGFFPAVFDDVLHDDRAFAQQFDQLRQHVARSLAVGLPLLVVFVCHAERLCYSGPLELWLYGNGANHDRSTVPPGVEIRRSRAEIERALANFRVILRYLRDTSGLAPITVRDMVARYGRQAATVTRTELTALATRAIREHQIIIGESASAAEALLGWAKSLATLAASGAPPATVARHEVLGPVQTPPLAPELPRLSFKQVATLAADVLDAVERTGHLPSASAIEGRRLGLGSVYGALAEAYVAASRGSWSSASDVLTQVWPRYPEGAIALGERQRLCEEDPLVRPGLSTETLALHARLQTWTLEPAQRR